MDEDNKVLTEALNLLVGFCNMGDILMAWDKSCLLYTSDAADE